MTSRERILSDVLKNQPAALPLPDISAFKGGTSNIVREYADMFTAIGGTAVATDSLNSVRKLIGEQFDLSRRTITTLSALADDKIEMYSKDADPHSFDDVELAIIDAHLAVAENGAVWVTETLMGQRIIPFICQHLAVVVRASSIVPTLHEAYKVIGTGDSGSGAFIGGPSKTADIEQSLVLGAHGPISMMVFIVSGDW